MQRMFSQTNTALSIQDFFKCKIFYPSQTTMPAMLETPVERMQSRVQQMNMINQEDKHGDKLKSS